VRCARRLPRVPVRPSRHHPPPRRHESPLPGLRALLACRHGVLDPGRPAHLRRLPRPTKLPGPPARRRSVSAPSTISPVTNRGRGPGRRRCCGEMNGGARVVRKSSRFRDAVWERVSRRRRSARGWSPMSSASYEAVAVQELGSDPPNAVLMARVKELEARAATLVRTQSS
jgi:hypothetical protein